MRFTDGLSLCGVMLVLVSLVHAARHGPTQPIYDAFTLSPPASLATVDPPPASTTRAPAPRPPLVTDPMPEPPTRSSSEARLGTRDLTRSRD